ncbi:MAG: GumC family protein, partial [bacterium]
EESTVVTESLVENLREQLSELEAERIDYLNQGLAESSPEIESLDRRITNLEQSIREYTREVTTRPEGGNEGLDYYNQLLAERTSLEAEIEGRKNEINILNQKISEYDEELGRLSDKGFQMARLERDVEITRNTYTMLSEELERSKISVEREMSDVRIIDEAQLPEAPISPRTLLNVFIACFLGIFAGTGLIFMLEYLDNTVKEKDELEHLTELPVLGVIPDIEKIDHKHSHYYGSDEN